MIPDGIVFGHSHRFVKSILFETFLSFQGVNNYTPTFPGQKYWLGSAMFIYNLFHHKID